MASTNTLFRASRPLFRQSAFGAQARQAFRAQQAQRFTQNKYQWGAGGKRWQSTADGAQQQGWFKRMWESEIGFKTVHFWAPVMKWCLVLAGVSDFARPAEKLSLTQNLALTATGLIWTRWCFVIRPKNYLLAAVNFFLGIVGIVQVSRITSYHMSQKEGVQEVVQEVKQDAAEIKKEIKENTKA